MSPGAETPARRCGSLPEPASMRITPRGRQLGSDTDLIERVLGFGLEGDRRGHACRLAPCWIISPLLRQIEAIGDRQNGRVMGKRERHRLVAGVLAGVLAGGLAEIGRASRRARV